MSLPAEPVSDKQPNRLALWMQSTGGVVAVLIVVQFLTGVLLAFYYVPSVDHAHATVSYIEKIVSSGSWLRALHHYGSQWLALFAFLHVLRLFWSKAYVDRRIGWIAAVLLLVLVIAAAGTGYSLPWDARAFFSTRVAEGLMGGLPFVGRLARLWLLGGTSISTITLSRFFALHVLVTPFLILAVTLWVIVWRFSRKTCWSNVSRNAIAGGLVFVALALWCLKYPAPLGPAAEAVSAEYLPRPGAQFLWLYQSLKYIPGGLGSIVGVVFPGVGLLILALLPWLNRSAKSRTPLLGRVVLAGFALWIVTTTIAAHLSDRRDPRTHEQLARQAAQESAWRSEPFMPTSLQSSQLRSQTSSAGGAPVLYLKFCADCHGAHGEGAQRGTLKFPPLLDVGAKPRRTPEDIVDLLKNPPAYGLQPPMRSFADKLTDEQMREIAAWVVTLKK
ncbi:MAG TPA: cytochrome b N-terminal domain-containing protein [Pyrinomonadaceae bacterium]|nr:cytochrome b N-terminal domain-containing protein [Pyrinomonadaceae bacterium]